MGKNGPEPDVTRLLSGHPESLKMPPAPKLPAGPWQVVVAATNTAWAGPWGVTFTANLTPDVGTGLGGWSAKQFADTMRLGKHLGVGRAILPPMPIPAYKHFDDATREADFAYLDRFQRKEPGPCAAAAARRGKCRQELSASAGRKPSRLSTTLSSVSSRWKRPMFSSSSA